MLKVLISTCFMRADEPLFDDAGSWLLLAGSEELTSVETGLATSSTHITSTTYLQISITKSPDNLFLDILAI